jgi:hypothetical protein
MAKFKLWKAIGVYLKDYRGSGELDSQFGDSGGVKI